MEKKNYERPVMGIETFVPNEFIAGCTIVIDKEYEVDPNGLKQGIHVKYDKHQDKVYESEDHGGAVFTSNTVHQGATLYYVGMGWGYNESGQITWPNPPKSQAEMKAEGIDMFYLLSNQPGEPTSSTGGIKVYGGNEIEKIIKNQS